MPQTSCKCTCWLAVCSLPKHCTRLARLIVIAVALCSNVRTTGISGQLPAELGKLDKLEELCVVGGCRFSCDAAWRDVCCMAVLIDRTAFSLAITGTIPPELGQCGAMNRLCVPGVRACGRKDRGFTACVQAAAR